MSGTSILSGRSRIVGCGYVEGQGHELTLILGRGYGRWSCVACGKSCTPLQGYDLLQQSRFQVKEHAHEISVQC
jgi:hypothetical protein